MTDEHPQLPPGSPLQACPQCAALIDITDHEPLDVIQCPNCGMQFAVSGQVASYQILEVAGRGGMGVVYKAYDPSLDRQIALKLLRKDHSQDEKLIQQLEAEAAITASVNDPNVVRVFGTGFDRGRFFLAMELVNLGSLDDLIRAQGRVAEAQVLRVGIQIATGLRAAWQHGLIHRDVKPGNILFSNSHTAKIVDFGLAIFMAQEESVRGEVWGTPYYVAPEKLDHEPEDFRSDMYSLGGTMFHALAGRPPFEAENASLVALKHLKSQAVSLQAFAPWISNPTAHIINRTLAKDPDARFQSYDELIHNLEYALEELEKRGASPAKRARVVLETEEDHRVWTWIVLGMAAIMVVLLGIFFANKSNSRSTTATKPASTTTTKQSASASHSFEAGLEPLAERKESAAGIFQKVAADEKQSAEDRAWSAYLQGIAELVANRTEPAQAAFKEAASLAAGIKDEGVQKFLQDTATRLGKPEPVPMSETSSLRPNNHEAIGFLAFGMHNWAAGQIEDGAHLLRQFRSAQPSTAYNWFGTLKPMVTAQIEDLGQFEMLRDQLQNAGNIGERAIAARAIRNSSKPLAAYGEKFIAPFKAQVDAYLADANKLPTDGVYRVYNVNSNKVWDVDGFHREQNTAIIQYNDVRTLNQSWEFLKQPGGSYRFRSLLGENVIDLADANNDEGGRVRMWESNNSDAQRWMIEFGTEGCFKIRAKASQKLITVKDHSKDPAVQLEQRSEMPGDTSQLFRFERIGDALGDGWFSTTIGDPKGPNRVEYNKGVFSLTNEGSDIWNRDDECTFVFRGSVGDFDLITRLVSLERADEWSKAAIMYRSHLTKDSPNATVAIAPDGRISHQRRQGGGEDSQGAVNHDLANASSKPGFFRWLKLQRRGGKFTSFQSLDGHNWTQCGECDFGMMAEGYLGIAVSSHNAKSSTGKFDNVTFTPR